MFDTQIFAKLNTEKTWDEAKTDNEMFLEISPPAIFTLEGAAKTTIK